MEPSTPASPEHSREELIASLRRSQIAGTPPPSPARGLSHWLRVLLVCNPFYLFSAAMLLWGLYLVSDDAHFPGRETAQLTLNFSALQVYEALLAATAIVLARRRIWYDSTLLVALENLLVLVPFFLITQAAWISQPMLWSMCGVTIGMTLLRFASLKRFFAELNLPRALLGAGLLLLVFNAALVLLFHHYNELKVGTKPTEGAAFELNRYGWLIALPLMVGLANLVPNLKPSGNLLPQRRWLPLGFFTLWLAGSTVNLCGLSYVYNFDWEFTLAIPALWTLTWTVWLRCSRLEIPAALGRFLLLPPTAAALLAANANDKSLLLLLTALNTVAYATCFLKRRNPYLSLNLAIVSFAILGSALVTRYQPALHTGFGGGECLLTFLAAYTTWWIFHSRNPKLGVLGALLAIPAAGMILPHGVANLGSMLHAGILFLLLHSLVWDDEADPTVGPVRVFACILWIAHSFFLLLWQYPHATLLVPAGALSVLGSCVALRLMHGNWRYPAAPISAIIALFLRPALLVATGMSAIPTGLLVMAASFLLFAFGTIAALNRHRWRHPEIQLPAEHAPTITRLPS